MWESQLLKQNKIKEEMSIFISIAANIVFLNIVLYLCQTKNNTPGLALQKCG